MYIFYNNNTNNAILKIKIFLCSEKYGIFYVYLYYTYITSLGDETKNEDEGLKIR